MKSIPTVLSSAVTGVLLFVLFNSALPAARAQVVPTSIPAQSPEGRPAAVDPSCDASRSVQVSGTAVINVTPDRALIQLGVQSNGLTPTSVEEMNTAAIGAVTGALRAQGVEARDIATDHYIIEPVYDSYTSLYIKGYRINNIVAVTLRDVSRISRVIVAALEAGANQVVNVDLYTSELRKYRDQARELAVKAAREKAQALASAAGAQAGCVLHINENSWSSYNGWWYGRNANQWAQNVIQNTAPAGGSSSSADAETISLGQISVRAEVAATFSLK